MRTKSNYTTGSISDIDYNVNYEAEGPFECAYVKTWTDLCCHKVYFMYTAKYNYTVSRSVSECNTTIYCSDINWTIVLGRTETIREDGTIIRTVGKARPWSSYQIPTPADRSPNNCVRR